MRHQLMLVAALVCGALSVSDAAVADPSYTIVSEIKKTEEGTVVTLTGGIAGTFRISDQTAVALTTKIANGDRIEIVLDNSKPPAITELKSVSKPTGAKLRLLALALGFGAVILVFSWASSWKPNSYIIGSDGRYSNSKTQAALWFSALMSVYLAALGLRVAILGWDFLGGINITENLLALSGLSVLTYGAAKAITVNKVADAATSVKTGGTPDIRSDLFQDDHGVFDLGDTQMFFFTLLVVAVFLLTSFHFLGWLAYADQITLPDIDTTILSGVGLGQGAYLAKKAASDPGKG